MKKRWFWQMASLLACVPFLFAACDAPSSSDESRSEPIVVQQYIVPPQSRGELLADQDLVAVVVDVEKTEVLEYTLDNASDNETRKARVATVKVKDVLLGDQKVGEKLQIFQQGDGTTIIYEEELQTGGYLEKGTKWFLFLEKKEFLNNTYFYIRSLIGQYELDDDGHIISQTELSKEDRYFGGVKTVEDMRKLIG